MTFLAHWKLDDGIGRGPTVAVDSAAGGTGNHDGLYTLASIGMDYNHYGRLLPHGVGGRNLFHQRNTDAGTVHTVNNIADLRLYSDLTVMAWIHSDEYYYWWNRASGGACYIVNVSGVDASAIENDLWDFRVDASYSRILSLRWQKGVGTAEAAISAVSAINLHGWTHVAAEREEFSPGKFRVNFYRDGTLHSTDDNGGAGFDPPTDGGNSLLFIGKHSTSNFGAPFSIDSVRVYDTVLGTAAIAAIYTDELKWFEEAPVKDWSIPERMSGVVLSDLYNPIDTGPGSTRINAGFTRNGI